MSRRGAFSRDPAAIVADAWRDAYDDAPLEEQFRAEYRLQVHERGGRSWHVSDSRGQASAVDLPDELTIIGPRLLVVELKAPGKTTTEGQREALALFAGVRRVEVAVLTSSGDRARDRMAIWELLGSNA